MKRPRTIGPGSMALDSRWSPALERRSGRWGLGRGLRARHASSSRSGGRALVRCPHSPRHWLAMASFEERIYGLAAEALAEQERQVAEIRTRGSTLVAAGAVVA